MPFQSCGVTVCSSMAGKREGVEKAEGFGESRKTTGVNGNPFLWCLEEFVSLHVPIDIADTVRTVYMCTWLSVYIMFYENCVRHNKRPMLRRRAKKRMWSVTLRRRIRNILLIQRLLLVRRKRCLLKWQNSIIQVL